MPACRIYTAVLVVVARAHLSKFAALADLRVFICGYARAAADAVGRLRIVVVVVVVVVLVIRLSLGRRSFNLLPVQ